MLRVEMIPVTGCGVEEKVYRAKVPGGWLVFFHDSVAFYADSAHLWDGSSLSGEKSPIEQMRAEMHRRL